MCTMRIQGKASVSRSAVRARSLTLSHYTNLLPIRLAGNATVNSSVANTSCPSSAADFFHEFTSIDFERSVNDLVALTLGRFLLFVRPVLAAVSAPPSLPPAPSLSLSLCVRRSLACCVSLAVHNLAGLTLDRIFLISSF